MSWQILVAVSVLTGAVSVLLQRLLLKDKRIDSVAFSIVFQLLNGVLILVYAFIRGFSVPDLRPLILNLILMTAFYGVGNILIFKALKIVEASEFTIVFASRSLWTILAAVALLGEAFSTRQLLGTLIILLSVAVVSWQKSFKLNRGLLLSIFAALCFGLAFANDAFIIRSFDVPSYLGLAFIAPALAVWAIFPSSTKKMGVMLTKEFLPKFSILAVFYSISAITIFLAYQVGRNAAQIAPLNQASTIVTVILAVIFLRERAQLARKIAGAFLSFIGVVLVG